METEGIETLVYTAFQRTDIETDKKELYSVILHQNQYLQLLQRIRD